MLTQVGPVSLRVLSMLEGVSSVSMRMQRGVGGA